MHTAQCDFLQISPHQQVFAKIFVSRIIFCSKVFYSKMISRKKLQMGKIVLKSTPFCSNLTFSPKNFTVNYFTKKKL